MCDCPITKFERWELLRNEPGKLQFVEVARQIGEVEVVGDGVAWLGALVEFAKEALLIVRNGDVQGTLEKFEPRETLV